MAVLQVLYIYNTLRRNKYLKGKFNTRHVWDRNAGRILMREPGLKRLFGRAIIGRIL
jgi:hypothetical protein